MGIGNRAAGADYSGAGAGASFPSGRCWHVILHSLLLLGLHSGLLK